jgi:pimeloyl-ACP methyl ester carboxylesterase
MNPPPPSAGFDRAVLEIGRHQLAYSQLGKGADVVLLHGTLTSLDDMMIALAGPLAAQHHVVAFDRPGHGGSTRPPGDGSLMTQARLVAEGIQRLELKNPILVGHSAGGALALTVALNFPEVVSGVVALAPLVFFEPRLEIFVFGPRGIPGAGPLVAATGARPSDAVLLPLLWNTMFMPQRMPAAFADAFPFAEFATVGEMVSTGEDALALAIDLPRNALSYAGCRVPVRILGGTGDVVVNNRMQGAMLSLFMPDCTFEHVEGLGHMLHHFMPDRVVQLVRELATQRKN